jgi:hypothetical protein
MSHDNPVETLKKVTIPRALNLSMKPSKLQKTGTNLVLKVKKKYIRQNKVYNKENSTMFEV